MSGRLPTRIIVSALLRRANDSGGFGAVLARGDPDAGSVLVMVETNDGGTRVMERGLGPDGGPAIVESSAGDDPAAYWQRRRSRDPDLWVVELYGPDSQRFVVETIGDD